MAEVSILTTFIGIVALFATNYAVSSVFSFWANLQTARRSGLPYVCRVVFEFNYGFLAIQPYLSKLIDRVPRSLDPSGYLTIYKKDWRVRAKYDKHRALGDVFWNVSPGLLLLEIADPDVVTELTTRRTDFVKPRWVFENIRLFGPNILEADELDWKRHRRIIGPRYSDALHSFVWQHACGLAKEMYSSWQLPESYIAYSPGVVSREGRDLGQLALRVIVGAAFTKFIPFHNHKTGPSAEDKPRDAGTEGATQFAESLMLVMSNLFTIMIFPKPLIAMSSRAGRNIARAIDDVRHYMHDMLVAEADKHKQQDTSNEKATISREAKSDTTILSGLADALTDGKTPGPQELTYDEAIGNIFLMALAGSATTGDTLHFAMVLLAIHQDIQSWVIEELDECVQEVGEDWTYQKVYAKLTRIHHVMMETLRLYPVTPVLPKWTADKTLTLNIGGERVVLPPKTVTVLSFPAIHLNPNSWGKDVEEFRPQRWEQFDKGPKEGSFVPFSRGARSCLGKRFSESEFTAVLSTLLRDHRIELAVGENETRELVRERAINALDKSETYMTLSVGDCVPLKWVKR